MTGAVYVLDILDTFQCLQEWMIYTEASMIGAVYVLDVLDIFLINDRCRTMRIWTPRTWNWTSITRWRRGANVRGPRKVCGCPLAVS